MSIDLVKSCSDALRTFVAQESPGSKLKASHAHELVAAILGFKSRAALRADTRFNINNLSSAEFFVPDVELVESRRQCLSGFPQTAPTSEDLCRHVVDHLAAAGISAAETHFSNSLGDFIVEHLLIDRDPEVMDCLSGPMAMTNADFDTYPDYDTEPVVAIGPTSTEITVAGRLSGTPSPEKVFSGDSILLKVEVRLDHKAGSRVFSTGDISASGEVDYDWGDTDSEPEPPLSMATFLERAFIEGPEEYNALVTAVSEITDTGLFSCNAETGGRFTVETPFRASRLTLKSEAERQDFLAMVKREAGADAFDGDFESWYGYTLAMENPKA